MEMGGRELEGECLEWSEEGMVMMNLRCVNPDE